MKKLLFLAVCIFLLTAGTFVEPIEAVVFRATIVRCQQPITVTSPGTTDLAPTSTPQSCGANQEVVDADGLPMTPAEVFSPFDPLNEDRSELRVTDTGRLDVDLDGALPNTTYDLFVGDWKEVPVGLFVFQFQFCGDGPSCCIGTVMTDELGNFSGAVTTAGGGDFEFPSETVIAADFNVAFNNPKNAADIHPTEFTTGILIPTN